MGKHFDALVEFASRHIEKGELSTQFIPDVKDYLDDIVNKAALFEFPLRAEEIFPKSGKDDEEYFRYLDDYFNMSKQYGIFFVTPFPITAVEDDISVVIMDNIGDNKYLITIGMANTSKMENRIIDSSVVTCGYVELEPPIKEALVRGIAMTQYFGATSENKRTYLGQKGFRGINQDMETSMAAYIEQIIYIMDPENFIIRKESTQSIKQKEKSRKKKRKRIFKKTIMRPHYICLSEEDTKNFLRSESKEPRAAHPVRGHWRRLMSERYKNKRGQRIYVRQYFTGEGKLEAKGGWNYEVMVKEDLNKITPYSKLNEI